MDKKQTTFLLVASLLVIVLLSFVFLSHKSTQPHAACPSIDEIPFGPPTLESIVKQSAVITRGELQITDDHNIAVQVSEPLKSKLIKKDEVIKLCQSNLDLTKVKYGDEVVIFLKGRDSERDAWSGSWQSYSTARINKGQVVIGEDSYDLGEIRQAAREN
jgi:hypothetical protein